ncbi:hypothetical protein ACFLRO_01940 [Bacteroidota bacterium]
MADYKGVLRIICQSNSKSTNRIDIEMSKTPEDRSKNELEVDLNSGEIIPEDRKKDYKAPEATKAGSLKNVSRTISGDGAGDGIPI